MKYENLSFDVLDHKGNKIKCDIISVVPNEENDKESYVVFTDYMLDENDEFVMQYGKVIEENGEYTLEKIDDPKIIDLIKDSLKDEIVKFVNTQVVDALN